MTYSISACAPIFHRTNLLYVFFNVRYHHYILTKNDVVTDQNRGLLVETLRSIAEILIWGDQNDSTVFEYGIIVHARFVVLLLFSIPFSWNNSLNL